MMDEVYESMIWNGNHINLMKAPSLPIFNLFNTHVRFLGGTEFRKKKTWQSIGLAAFLQGECTFSEGTQFSWTHMLHET